MGPFCGPPAVATRAAFALRASASQVATAAWHRGRVTTDHTHFIGQNPAPAAAWLTARRDHTNNEPDDHRFALLDTAACAADPRRCTTVHAAVPNVSLPVALAIDRR